jgi:ABC-type multidrug transport system ATPase subunit
MTLREFLLSHSRFKNVLPGLTIDRIISITGLEPAANKQIRYFSSGMKQRVKLAQAILFDTGAILLDEPCSNLDADGIRLYHELIQTYCTHRLVIVSSNDETEYSFCRKIVSIQEFKQQPGLMLR